MELYIYLSTFILTLIGFIYGFVRFFKKGKALYLWMITLGVGCAMLSSLFEFLQILTQGVLPFRFNVGMLGTIGTFLFFFTANYGQMDSLADDGSKKFLKYRIYGLIAPLILLIMYIPALFCNIDIGLRIAQIVILFVIMLASYFHFKHFIFPDVDYGIIKCIRGYNIMALLYAICSVLNMVLKDYETNELWIVTKLLGNIILLCMLPVLEREVKKWTI